MGDSRILLIEPFYTGSHKQLIDLLHKEVASTELWTLPGKKWHWKARTSALWFCQAIPRKHSFKTLFTSSVLNLAELTALRPDLAALHKVIYFHENQLVYPVRKQQDRDFQFGYNQILSSMVADTVLFNSKYNMDSYLNSINSHLKLIPDHRPKGIVDQIRSKCHVLHYPIVFPVIVNETQLKYSSNKGSDDCLENSMETCEGNAATGMKKDTEDTMKKDTEDTTQKDTEDSIQKSDNRLESECNKNTNSRSMLTEFDRDEDVKLLNVTVESDTGDGRNDSDKVVSDCAITVNCNTQSGNNSVVSDEVPAKKSKIIEQKGPLHIVWPHRWEHDKDPDTFFKVLINLHNDGLPFKLSVLGEIYSEIPEVFDTSKSVLQDKILHWGFLSSKQQYFEVLKSADCVVSTANHEFFGVAMLEAVHLGCYPLCPNKLVYPEIFPRDCLYNTEQQLYKRLREFCRKPYIPRSKQVVIDTIQFSWENLRDQFLKYLCS